ncbi:LAETG motif-containing sortase-dependent surface protein [Streptomyces sp. NPDC050549]|uniref:LAETG motif-containing sortase-dependent surface protein n=1 Tax=Streptomyces sp. NPDC050549 TaxID=3155406 RepID=UPI0034166323
MSLSPRAARAARVIGTSTAAVALSLAAAHTALACSIGDFTAVPLCDAQDNGVIRVTDKDASGTPATIELWLQLNFPTGSDQERLVATKTIAHPTAGGVSVDFKLDDWYAGVTFRVHVKAGDQVDDDITPMVVVPDVTCGASASASASASAPASASAQPSTSSEPSSTPSTPPPSASFPSPLESSSPVPAASGAPSPAGGGTHLAETGAGNGTIAFAGTAAALVAAGGGIVVALRRRAGRGSR